MLFGEFCNKENTLLVCAACMWKQGHREEREVSHLHYIAVECILRIYIRY